jgi:outer membrane protein OmpA-like peptidoglycan-associated protein
VRKNISLSVEFEFNSDKLKPTGLAAIAELSTALQSDSLLLQRFKIEGHTDSVGKPAYNMKLSARRAEAVCAQLEKLGVDRSRLEAVGKGSSEPLESVKPDAPQNRRVNIVSFE